MERIHFFTRYFWEKRAIFLDLCELAGLLGAGFFALEALVAAAEAAGDVGFSLRLTLGGAGRCAVAEVGDSRFLPAKGEALAGVLLAAVATRWGEASFNILKISFFGEHDY